MAARFVAFFRSLPAMALLGIAASLGVVLTLGLPEQITRGEKGQAAIQMLDSMRRPFLSIKQAEDHLDQQQDGRVALRSLTPSLAIRAAFPRNSE